MNETLDWTTQKGAYHATRVTCDALGVSYAKTISIPGIGMFSQKDVICACIYQESEFLNRHTDGSPTKFENKDKVGRLWSTDWGIAQINDYWHIEGHGPGHDFPSIDYVMQNPDKAVEWMIKQFQAGNGHLWSSYQSGAYEEHLAIHSPMWELAQ